MIDNDSSIENIAYKFRPFELAKILPFRDAMRLANKFLTYDYLYEPWRHYAIEFLYAIRDEFPLEWDLSWLYDAYLGDACVFARRYDERYQAYREAMVKVSPIPPELLVALASCNSMPGKPIVSEDEAVKILTGLASKNPSKDIVRMLIKGHYKKLSENPAELAYWEQTYKNLENLGEDKKLPPMIPPFLTEDIETNLSQLPCPPARDKNEELLRIAKKIFSREKIPSSVQGIAIEWNKDEIVLTIYHEGKVDEEIESMSLMTYTKIVANYMKDYFPENSRIVQSKSSKDLPYHKNWILKR